MEMQQLRCFLAVLDHGSFSRAASELGRTQQAVSKAIRTLEDSVGVRLLDRSPGVVRPTAFGRVLEDYARRIAADEAGFRARLRELLQAGRGSVRIGASATAAGGVVVAALNALRATHPGLSLTVVDGILPTLVARLVASELDLAVCIDTDPDGEVSLPITKETLGEEEYRVIASTRHPLAAHQVIGPADLASAEWILGSNLGHVERAFKEAFATAGIAPPVPVLETTSIEFARSALVSGMFLAVLPIALVRRELAAGQLGTLNVPGFVWKRPVALLYRRALATDAALLAVLDALHTAARYI